MLLYKFEAAIPWRVALTKDETGETLPCEGAPWRPGGSVELEPDDKFMGVPLNEVLGTIQTTGHFIWVTTPQPPFSGTASRVAALKRRPASADRCHITGGGRAFDRSWSP
jgi:hypothetical protein